MKLKDTEFKELSEYMRTHYGINLEKKHSLIEGRLSTMLEKKGYTSFGQYFDEVLKDPRSEEMAVLVSKLTTNFTYFYREEQHYNFLVERALPEIVPTIRDHDLRIWSAGCSSGEEAYTTAIVLDDYFGEQKKQWDTTILATDISENILNRAKTGIYHSEALSRAPEQWKNKYFNKIDADTFKVNKKIDGQVVFGHYNLMSKTIPFRRNFHIIFCRNVMIYFNKQTKEEVSNRFYSALEPGGYLFIGLSETMAGLDTEFEYVQPSIYHKKVR